MALAYGLYATMVDFHKEHEGKGPLSRKGKIGIAVLVIASTLAIVADFGDKTSAAAEKARAQKAQDAVTAEQLSRLSGLASDCSQLNVLLLRYLRICKPPCMN